MFGTSQIPFSAFSVKQGLAKHPLRYMHADVHLNKLKAERTRWPLAAINLYGDVLPSFPSPYLVLSLPLSL